MSTRTNQYNFLGVIDMEVYIKKILASWSLKDVYDFFIQGILTVILGVFLAFLPRIGYHNYVSSIQSKYAVSSFDGVPATNNINKETISKNIDILAGLRRENWEKLSLQQRLDIMQTVANIEAQHLNIPFGVKVITLENMPEDLFAAYSNEKKRIIINMDSLGFDPPIFVLESVCHEMRHCYQHVQADKYAKFSSIDKEIYQYEPEALIAAELADYKEVTLDGNYEEYATQLCETEARMYSDYAILDYLNALSIK